MTFPDREHAALVALLARTPVPAPNLAERVEHQGALTTLAEELGAGTTLLPEDPMPAIEAAAVEIRAWAARGLRLVTVLDAAYPENLRLVHDRPAVLVAAGDLDLLDDTRAIAIVGARRASPAGLAFAARIAAELVAANHVVVSGLAAGIDTAAHRGALAAGGRTVAMIGTGHDHAYPPENRTLQHELGQTQLVVSPFGPDSPPHPDRFRHRNGAMSGLARGTVIVEASVRSGTRVQARLALGHGRPVFLARPLLDQAWAAALVQRPGVHVVDSADDVLAVTAALHDLGPLTGPGGP